MEASETPRLFRSPALHRDAAARVLNWWKNFLCHVEYSGNVFVEEKK